MATDEARDPDKVRSTVIVTPEQAERFKAEGKRNRHGWTVEIIMLAEEALNAREKARGG